MIQNMMVEDYMGIQISLEVLVVVVSIVLEMDHRNYWVDKMNMELNNDDMLDLLLNEEIDNHLSQARWMDQYMLVMMVDKDVDEYDDDDV
jgi:hypothetical protein